MKLFSVSLALAACLSMAAAQGLDGLPDCAKSCATNSIPARCGFDVKCICTDSSFISGISCCVLQSCAADQQQAAVEFANRICRTAGVTNMPQSPSCANATQSATGTPSGSSTSTSSSSTESNASQTAATATTSTTTSSTTGSATSSAASATNSSTGAAVAQHKDTGLIALAGAALAAFGLLA
ncbi:GPI anchored CFEM domain protein C [Aspergillus lentulus]|uniref:GPI anchored CFEM domain protein C n=1 Tax=Aspergillus lentulus TaxID=293939 RepID=A0ABQ1A911_ASPLE|nr:GPI anchored CFEM domain protein C [Aspergillus lentulus]GFF27884.1 GPI anchored CFEM domain protein C [Aspergillus lentulus]GFF76459.1 GPI anchored CFEM domain protein C [Aspergillus lentulus]GFG02764.1 GPI anchored CFEM domain protein C [Aspergillus lentulus]